MTYAKIYKYNKFDKIGDVPKQFILHETLSIFSDKNKVLY